MLSVLIETRNDEEGLAIEVWRNHCLHGGGQGSPPKGIKDLFINPAKTVQLLSFIGSEGNLGVAGWSLPICVVILYCSLKRGRPW